MQPESAGDELPAVIAPYSDNPKDLHKLCFDRRTGRRVPISILKTYRETLAEYPFHSEAKFGNGNGFESGLTTRRHIQAIGLEYIGKEANRWEEQLHVGELPEAQVEYGFSRRTRESVIGFLRGMAARYSIVALAADARITRQELAAVLMGRSIPRPRTLRRILVAARGQLQVQADQIQYQSASQKGFCARNFLYR